MFGSQALETAIGLSLLFFVLAFVASSALEAGAQAMRKRSRDLESAVKGMLQDPDAAGQLWSAFTGTSVWQAAQAGAKRASPSYLSAKSFAEAVTEALATAEGAMKKLDKLPPALRDRIKPVVRTAVANGTNVLLDVKADLEQWFDGAMTRLEGAYRRWSKVVLFFIGLFLAVAANASAFHVADRLWHEPSTREAVANAAGQVSDATVDDIKSVGETTGKLEELRLPVGWDEESKSLWSDHKLGALSTARAWGMILGWLATAFLVCLGAPFWYDLLTKLTPLRAAGTKPLPPADDPTSATALKAAAKAPGSGAVGAFGGTPSPGAPNAPIAVDSALAGALGLTVQP